MCCSFRIHPSIRKKLSYYQLCTTIFIAYMVHWLFTTLSCGRVYMIQKRLKDVSCNDIVSAVFTYHMGRLHERRMRMALSSRHYHHGQTIKEFRQRLGITQEALAACWPRANGDMGVLPRYVQDVEYGQKHIHDPHTLRQLAVLLQIPLWRFGLSEYDPFDPTAFAEHGQSVSPEMLDVIEQYIQQIWGLRCAARLDEAERGVVRLKQLFASLQGHTSPPQRLTPRLLLLYAQMQRLDAVTAVEQQRYENAIVLYQAMLRTAREADDTSLVALALMSLGTEYERKGELQTALSLLEEARDASFGASKQIIAFVHTYLARVYASVGDMTRFERAIHTAMTMANQLNGRYGDGSEYVFGRISSILAEQSYGYLELGAPQKTLDMRDEIATQALIDQDTRLQTWIPLDWARAYHQLGHIEACVHEAFMFYRRADAMCSGHATSQAFSLLHTLEQDGYGALNVVRSFRAALHA